MCTEASPARGPRAWRKHSRTDRQCTYARNAITPRRSREASSSTRWGQSPTTPRWKFCPRRCGLGWRARAHHHRRPVQRHRRALRSAGRPLRDPSIPPSPPPHKSQQASHTHYRCVLGLVDYVSIGAVCLGDRGVLQGAENRLPVRRAPTRERTRPAQRARRARARWPRAEGRLGRESSPHLPIRRNRS
jgi:hypothetical protein